MRIKYILDKYPEKVKKFTAYNIDFTKIFTVVELHSGGIYVETSSIDSEGIETIELLYQIEGDCFKLISRERHGANHHPLKSYPRDTQYPLQQLVRL